MPTLVCGAAIGLSIAAAPVVSGFGRAQSVFRQTQSAPATTSPQQALVSRYCVTCHNDRSKTGGLSLEKLDVSNVGAHAEVWEKVVQKLHGNLMPPPGRPKPDEAALDSLMAYLETSLDRAAGENPNPGRTEALHRLNRAEYRNAVRDLLALDIDVSAMLPADDVSYGFDNIAGVQRMSPTLMERYLAAAQKISSAAVGASPRAATTETFLVPSDLRQDDRLEGLPFGTRGGARIRHTFPRDGTYSVRVQLTRYLGASFDDIPAFDQSQRLELSVDGTPVHVFELNPASEGRPRVLRTEPARARRRLAGPLSGEGRRAGRRAGVSQPDAGAARKPARAVRQTDAGWTERVLHDAEGCVPSKHRNQRALRSHWRWQHAQPRADFRLPSKERASSVAPSASATPSTSVAQASALPPKRTPAQRRSC